MLYRSQTQTMVTENARINYQVITDPAEGQGGIFQSVMIFNIAAMKWKSLQTIYHILKVHKTHNPPPFFLPGVDTRNINISRDFENSQIALAFLPKTINQVDD